MTDTFEIVPELPSLDVPAPACGHCGEDVSMDGDFAWCEGCRVSWDRIEDGRVSVPAPDAEGSGVPCEITEPAIRADGWDMVFGPCVLPSGHEGDHLAPYVPTGCTRRRGLNRSSPCMWAVREHTTDMQEAGPMSTNTQDTTKRRGLRWPCGCALRLDELPLNDQYTGHTNCQADGRNS